MKINVKKSLFYSAYFLFLFSSMFECVYIVDNYIKFIKVVSIVILLLQFLLLLNKGYTINNLLAIISLLILNFFVYYISGEEKLLINYLFIICAKEIDIDKFIKYDAKLKIIFLIIVILLFYLGFTKNYNMIRPNGQIRYSMGFSHPNIFSTYVFSALASLFYVLYKNETNKKIFIMLLLFAICSIYYLADSRTIILSLILLLIFNIFKFKPQILRKVQYLPLILLCVSLIIGYKYNASNNIMSKTNELLSQRLYFMNKYLNNYSINLFGNKLEYISSIYGKENGIEAMILDNSYLLFILRYGIINTIVFGYLLINTLKKYSKENILNIIFTVFLIYGLFESGLINLDTNIFLLYLSNYFYKLQNIGVKQKEINEKNRNHFKEVNI